MSLLCPKTFSAFPSWKKKKKKAINNKNNKKHHKTTTKTKAMSHKVLGYLAIIIFLTSLSVTLPDTSFTPAPLTKLTISLLHQASYLRVFEHAFPSASSTYLTHQLPPLQWGLSWPLRIKNILPNDATPSFWTLILLANVNI